MIRLLLLFFLTTGCSYLKKDNAPVSFDADLKDKQVFYCEQSAEKYMELGYVHSKCDGLLFTSIHAITCDYVDINAFQKSPGLWKRSPTHDCFEKGESKSGVSRDMLLGLLLYAWQYNQPGIVQDLIAYGEKNDWDMCGGEYEDESVRIGRCLVTPTLKATIYELGAALGLPCDTKCNIARSVPQVWDPHVRDFQAHLLQIHILLRGLIQGAINDIQVDQLRWQAERNPKNALFTANYALWTGINPGLPVETLSSTMFPLKRLPGSQDRCGPYLWERDLGDSWRPCEAQEIHSGTDYLIVSAILLNELRGQNGYAEP